MPSAESNPAKLRATGDERMTVVALTALAWTLEDPARARRLLDLTGLSPEALRAGAGDRHILGALLDFLAGNERDLVACAEAIGVGPAELIAARAQLNNEGLRS